MRSSMLLLLLTPAVGLAFGAGCDTSERTDDDSSSDGDSDGDTDSDSDSDSDTDTDSDSDADCTSCHGCPPATGRHLAHTAYGCYTCHNTVVDAADNIINETLHSDDNPDIDFSGGGTYTDGECSGTCHGMTLTW